MMIMLKVCVCVWTSDSCEYSISLNVIVKILAWKDQSIEMGWLKEKEEEVHRFGIGTGYSLITVWREMLIDKKE